MNRLKHFSSCYMPFIGGLIIVFCLSGFKILDPASKNSLLRELAEFLDAKKIDVMLDWQSNISTEGRPVLAPLANYLKPSQEDVTKFESAWEREFDGWVDAFDKGDLQIILAAPTGTGTQTFKEKWDRAQFDKRIFLSFANEDNHLAGQIREVLELKGYTVFTYVNGSDMELSANKIAYYMTTSGNRLVLDTENSRLKSGVLAESLAEARYRFAVNKNLTQKIDELKVIIEGAEYDYSDEIEELQRKNASLTAAQAEQKLALQSYQLERDRLLAELGREQTSGRIQIEILLKALDFICPVYKIPKIACPICGPKYLTR